MQIKGPMTGQVTDRDREILKHIVRHGAATVDQLQRRFFTGRSQAYARLGRLAGMKLVRLARVLHGEPGVYVVTATGAALADCDLPAARLKAGSLRHHLMVADLAEHLLGEHPDSTWTTERELRRDILRGRRDLHSGRLGPAQMSRTPDGLLTMADGKTVAIELELSNKSNQLYRNIIGVLASHRPADKVVWFVRSKAAQERIAAEAQPFHLPASYLELRPLPWPKVKAP